jgi:hypothetical protein
MFHNFSKNNQLYRFTAILILLLLTPLFATAQSSITIPHISAAIEFDGMPDEEIWQVSDPLPMRTYFPEHGLQPTEVSDVRLLYDNEYLYIGARLFDSNPFGIQSTSFQRNFEDLSNDKFGIILDTFNNNDTAIAFFTNPGGARADFIISNDAEGGSPFNYDWDTFWDVETVQNDQGWFVEMRIPLSSLRFQVQDGHVTMGMTVMRWIARKNESNVFPAIPNNWGFNGQYKPSQTHTIVFEELEYTRPLQITPYLLGGFSQEHQLSETGEQELSYFRDDQMTHEAGLDIKYGFASNMTLDLTLNTDFAQVEADDQQVNLTRFALYLPEKRKFFQERSDLFDVNMGGNNRLFYSRRIGIRDGQQIRILGGARVTGSLGSWDIGVINMQTARLRQSPSENFGAFRLRRNVLNNNSHIGTLLTSRLSEDGYTNYSFGFDGVFHLFGDDYLSVQYGQTIDSEVDLPITSLHATRTRIDWQTRRIAGFGYNLGFSRNGYLFDPGVGFAGRKNYSRFGLTLNYGWYGSEVSQIQNHQISVGGNLFLVDNTGELESINVGPEWEVNWKSGSSFSAELTYNYEDLKQTFFIFNDSFIPADIYEFFDLELNFNTPEGGLYNAEATVTAGQFFDGYRISTELTTRLSLSRHFNLQPYYEYNLVEFPDRDQAFSTHISRLRAEYYLNTRFSIRAFIQYSNESELIFSNIRLRYNPREGNDFYILFNENVNSNRFAYSPVRPFSQSRGVLVKYTYTF